jgi:hypothetical protein
MPHYHAVAWIDHREAHVFHVARDAAEGVRVQPQPPAHATGRAGHLHHHAGSRDGKRQLEDQTYYRSVVEALDGAEEWLIVGPGSAKLELVKHVARHHAPLMHRIVGVETVDHPTDPQLLAFARRYFVAADRRLLQAGHQPGSERT